MTSVLGQQRTAFWNDNGFLVLPGFFSSDEVEAVRSGVDRAWDELPATVVVDDIDTNVRSMIGDVTPEARAHRFKVNDLYLEDRALMEATMSERLGMVLSELLGDEPVVCNTLNFAQGSQQADHLDTLYMTPKTERSLVATWMALEDTHADAGPLRYYPGSNHIDPYYFKDGSMHFNNPEMEQWSDYMATGVEKHGLQEQTFLAKKGDLFIWHALLLHGGSEICNPGLTRESIVTHYFTQADCRAMGSDMRPAPGGYYMQKPPLHVPAPSAPVRAATMPASEPYEIPVPTPAAPQATGRELRERMDPLLTATD